MKGQLTVEEQRKRFEDFAERVGAPQDLGDPEWIGSGYVDRDWDFAWMAYQEGRRVCVVEMEELGD